jgi:hypothetical protein
MEQGDYTGSESTAPDFPPATCSNGPGPAQMLKMHRCGLGRAHETISGSVSHACTNHASLLIVVVPSRR